MGTMELGHLSFFCSAGNIEIAIMRNQKTENMESLIRFCYFCITH